MDRQREGRKPAGGHSDSYISFYAFFHVYQLVCSNPQSFDIIWLQILLVDLYVS